MVPALHTMHNLFYYYFDYFSRVSVRRCLFKLNMLNGFRTVMFFYYDAAYMRSDQGRTEILNGVIVKDISSFLPKNNHESFRSLRKAAKLLMKYKSLEFQFIFTIPVLQRHRKNELLLNAWTSSNEPSRWNHSRQKLNRISNLDQISSKLCLLESSANPQNPKTSSDFYAERKMSASANKAKP